MTEMVFQVSFTVLNRAPPPMRAMFTLLWTWLHLLQFCVSNQRTSSIEDAYNKPWRPIPSSRISPRQTHLLRLLLVALCIAVSFFFGTMTLSAIFALLTFAHNDTPLGQSNWVTRNLLVAAGYAILDIGATIVASQGEYASDCPRPPANIFLDQLFLCNIIRRPLLNAAMIFTTVHAQDFADERGDRLKGRRTIPIVMPKVGRLSIVVGLMTWSTILTYQYALPVQVTFALVSMGAYTGGRYYYARSPAADRHSYLLYNVRDPVPSERQRMIAFQGLALICSYYSSLREALKLFHVLYSFKDALWNNSFVEDFAKSTLCSRSLEIMISMPGGSGCLTNQESRHANVTTNIGEDYSRVGIQSSLGVAGQCNRTANVQAV